MPKPKDNNLDWEDKLFDLVEKEIELASGIKSKEHFSGDCKMNDILDLVRKTRQQAVREVLEEVEEMEEIFNKRMKDKIRKCDPRNMGKDVEYWSNIKDGHNEATTNLKAKITNLKKRV